ncbi:MAG: NUDIX domain-containing protein [Nitrosopumilaceae archaeon]
MHSTKIVTSFVANKESFLLLKRSNKVKSMRGLWSGVSGIIEKNETPLTRAKTEIFEELGINEKELVLVKRSKKIRIASPQYKNHEWIVFPFLFSVKKPKINLNWENSDYRWVNADDIVKYKTVPSLDKVLFSLL